MKENILLFLVVAISGLCLIYGSQDISIGYDEASTFFYGKNLTHYIVAFSTKILGQNDFALRLPFIIFHLLSIILLYKISKPFLKKKIDRILSITIYALLPGVNSVALLVNSGSIVIFLTLLFVYLHMREKIIPSYIVLILSLFVDNSFVILYLALFSYAIFNRKSDMLFLTLILFGLSMYMYGFDTGGKPKGYFIDTLGIYAIIFSPLLFLYFIYALYRILIKEEKNLLWYISFFSLLFSLLLSLRQKLLLEDFAPFVVLAIPLMIKVFFNSYRVRLPVFRKLHTLFFGLIIFSLVSNTLVIFFNKPLYRLIDEPSKHFAINYHIAKELAFELKVIGVQNLSIRDEKMALRLKFYGIEKGEDYILSTKKEADGYIKQIDIAYFGKSVKTFYLYRI
ncbi:MAG: glycosyltransferase family 39 protein [Campylobacteraceae bacterium]|nr:glycosyltransferase family 39 protein [Campylobacteraceae bacterium]